MAWYYGTYACGHKGRVNVIGKMSDRQWKVDRHFENICEECRQKKIEEKNKEAEEKTKEYEFPDLTGTEKQIAWANAIRMDFYERCTEQYVVPDDVVMVETDAKFWIDNRYSLDAGFVKRYLESKEKQVFVKKMIDNYSARPDEIKHDGVVEIVKEGSGIALYYEKDRNFIELVKTYGYKWDHVWCRELSETTGPYEDRAAEIGNALLKNGFCICIHDKDILKKAASGNYKPEHTKWIKSRADSTFLAINWKGRDNELYKKARAIRGSKYDSPSVIVDVSHYRSVTRFAKENGFYFTKAAEEKIERYKQEIKKIKKANDN